jgi:hypothetical protein
MEYRGSRRTGERGVGPSGGMSRSPHRYAAASVTPDGPSVYANELPTRQGASRDTAATERARYVSGSCSIFYCKAKSGWDVAECFPALVEVKVEGGLAAASSTAGSRLPELRHHRRHERAGPDCRRGGRLAGPGRPYCLGEPGDQRLPRVVCVRSVSA